MRNLIDIAKQLSEAKTFSVDLWGGKLPNGEVRIWDTPTHKELIILLSKMDLRGILERNRYYVWDASKSIHSAIDELIYGEGSGKEKEPRITMVLVSEGESFEAFGYWEGEGLHHNGVGLMTENGEEASHMEWPAMQKLLGN